MPALKRACGVIVAISLFASGCSIPLGYGTQVVSSTTERVPLAAKGAIESEVRAAPGHVAVIKLTRQEEVEVRTIELRQAVRREYDLTGLWIGIGFGIGIGFIVLLIVGLNNGGGSSDGDDWD